MTTQTKQWLIVRKISEELAPAQSLQQLYELLQASGHVSDLAVLKEDIADREQLSSFQLSEHLYLPHARTDGVSQLCAAVLVTPSGKLSALLCWPENSAFILKQLAVVLDLLLNQKFATVLAGEKDERKLISILERELMKNGVSVTDCEQQ